MKRIWVRRVCAVVYLVVYFGTSHKRGWELFLLMSSFAVILGTLIAEAWDAYDEWKAAKS